MQHVNALSPPAQQEVLDFVEFLEAKSIANPDVRQDDESWAALSLATAMRGMETEETPYSAADIKERFS